MGNTNEMMIEFDAVGENEGFARVVVAEIGRASCRERV